MELEEALARIAALERDLEMVRADRDNVTAERNDLANGLAGLEAVKRGVDTQLAEANHRADAAANDAAATRVASLSYLRRALLAEHAGQCVPELVIGESEAALLASLDVAKGAYVRALDTARAAIVSQTVPAGAPSARSAGMGAGLSALQLIESGLRGSRT